MRLKPIILALFLVAGCAGFAAPKTPAQAIFDAQITLNGALGAVRTYVVQPTCVTDMIVGCIDANTKRDLKKRAEEAWTALEVAKSVLQKGGQPNMEAVRVALNALINDLYRRGKIK